MQREETSVEEFTKATFDGHVGTSFSCTDGEQTVEFELIEVSALGRDDPQRDASLREPFSIVFRGGPAALPQAIYQLQHDQLGSMEIFLVPVGQDSGSDGIFYEAIFN